MYWLKFVVRAEGERGELSPTSLDVIAIIAEVLMSLALLQEFETIIVEDMELIHLPLECDDGCEN